MTQFPNLTLSLGAECFDYARAFSYGVWMLPQRTSIIEHPLFRFHIQAFVYISIGNVFHHYLKRFYIPKVSSEILAGIVLGPCFFEKYFPRAAGMLFNTVDGVVYAPNNVMASIGRLGYVIFIFLAGVRMDPGLVRRMGREPIILALAMSIIPYVFIATLRMRFLATFPGFMTLWRYRFMLLYFQMAIHCHFVGVVQTLLHLKITNSRLGQIAMATQLVTELVTFAKSAIDCFVFRWELLTANVAFFCISFTLLYYLGVFFGLPPVINNFIRSTPEGLPVKKLHINVLVAIMLAATYMAEAVGTYFFFGPFVCGLLVPSGTPVARDLISKLDSFVSGTMLPLMVTFVASKFNFQNFLLFPPVVFYISVIALLVKVFITIPLGMASCKLSISEASALSLVLHSKGVLEMGMFLLYGSLESRDPAAASGALFVLIFSAAFTPLIRLLYDPARHYVGFNTRSILSSKPEEILNILACARRQEDAFAVVNLLRHIPSTKQSRLCLSALCLEELVASFTPVLINHQLNQKGHPIYGSRSQSSLETFVLFRSQSKSHQVQIFTAVSHLHQMHVDICWLSFQNRVSMIIMPFHKTWNRKTRQLVSGSNDLRMVNVEVLDRAPCSTAILVDRHSGFSDRVPNGKDYLVCVLFVSGIDDREALAFAARMVGNESVKLTVLKLTLRGEQNMEDWESMLDTEAFRKFKEHVLESDVTVCFKDETVDDSIGFAAVLQNMMPSYDLIIVGRRHNPNYTSISQLSEWTELPELGPVGDILASEDVKYPVSVLIIQHQNTKVENNNLTNRPGGA